MSDPVSKRDIDRLVDSLDKLTLAVRERGIASDPLEGWELIEGGCQGPAFGAVRHHRAEEPPPEVPAQILTPLRSQTELCV